jgi:hypothetical protein
MIDRKRLTRWISVTLGSILAFYVVSYFGLSLCGGYSKYVSRSGNLRYSSGMSLADVREWEPCGIVEYNSGANSLGLLYALLVDIDRKFWHKPIDIFKDDRNSLITDH